MKSVKFASALLSAALMFGSSLTASAADDLDGAAITKVHTGREINAVTHDGRKFIAKFYANGRMDGTIPGDATNVDTGTWRVDENRLCWKWFKWEEGKELCYDVVDLGESRYRAVETGGRGTTTYTVR